MRMFLTAVGWSAGFVAVTMTAPAVSGADEARSAFLRLIDRPRVAADAVVRSVARKDGLVVEDLTYASDAADRVSTLLVQQEGSQGPRPVVIALHGTGGNKDGELPFLTELARAGFIGVAIDGRYHGERAGGRGRQAYQDAILRAYRGSGEHPFFVDTVWDVMRLIDYLGTRKDVDPKRIGLFGISKGGIETYLTAAVDPRVAAAVPCIGVESFRWADEHDAWHSRIGTIQGAFDAAAKDAGVAKPDGAFVHGFYARVATGIDGPFDGPAMVPLIAPRPLLSINGDSDPRTPKGGLDLCVAAARDRYAATGHPEAFQLLLEPHTGHKVTPEGMAAAKAWFVRWLKP